MKVPTATRWLAMRMSSPVMTRMNSARRVGRMPISFSTVITYAHSQFMLARYSVRSTIGMYW